MTAVTCIEDLRRLAKRRVPHMFYDYVDGGSWTESTYRANEADLLKIKFRQRVAINLENRSTATQMAGQSVTMPVALAPTGLTGFQHADGEILAARAARRFGIPFTLSTLSICSIEDVARHAGEGFWFQLYVMRDRDYIERLIDRAKAANCGALVLTLDLQIPGQRHKDLKNGLSAPPRLTLPNLINMVTRPRWCLGMLGTRRRNFGNVIGHVRGVENMGALSAWTTQQFDPTLSWRDVEWISRRWGGKLIVKGIQDVEDARIAVDCGVDALVVSNHGGRQLDGAASSVEALPAIVAAVGSQIEVHMDGGIRSGQDVLKAYALGARGTYIGRAFLYGLAAMGEIGVTKTLEIIQKELDLTMAFCGKTNIAQVDTSILLPGTFLQPDPCCPWSSGCTSLRRLEDETTIAVGGFQGKPYGPLDHVPRPILHTKFSSPAVRSRPSPPLVSTLS
ncbi:alpha-hydroxy-acid oxidizing protein [Burkholderia diffusa]|nr:alpha-hydroxy-acid oxidizing protein [Burkholderia diffusa]